MSNVARSTGGRHAVGLALAFAILLATAVPSANAQTVRRSWTGTVGAGGVNGVARLHAYTDGTGGLAMTLKSLAASRSYAIEIRRGTCSTLGTTLVTLFPFTSEASGTASVIRNVPGAKMNTIWSYGQTRTTLALRVVAAGSVRCGTISYPVATRIAISALGLNLAVIRPPSGYPPCNVAMYQPFLAQPREPSVTMIYAHARRGMFLPLLSRSKIGNGASLLGMRVTVYTSDSRVSVYRIDRVRRHVTSIQDAFSATGERLWLQTSEGPNLTYPKLVVEARRLSTSRTTYTAAHPRPRAVRCG